MKKKEKKKKKKRLLFNTGIINIISTYNNIIISLTDEKGNVILWSSSGKMGFKGSKKSTPFAAQMAAKDVSEKGFKMGIIQVNINISGPGSGRDTAIRTIYDSGIKILSIKDITPLPHNGCRAPKKRRI